MVITISNIKNITFLVKINTVVLFYEYEVTFMLIEILGIQPSYFIQE